MAKYDSGKDWTFDDIERLYDTIKQISDETLQLDHYPNQIEIITYEQMIDAYTNTGLPLGYAHWSFGKRHVAEMDKYKTGSSGLAYEIVINSSPCISYLMESNTLMMQALVIAHACFGHNSFFKANTHFRQWTDATTIIDYLDYAKKYIAQCEEKYGPQEVERVLDACHAIQYNSIDRYKRPNPKSKKQRHARDVDRALFEEQHNNVIWSTIPKTLGKTQESKGDSSALEVKEDNLLYFIEHHAPNMEDWKREICQIVRTMSQYFYPQMLTQIMNEGHATFVHYTLINEMHARGLVTDGFMLEFIQSHTGVIRQQAYSRSLNPYALGFAIYSDIKRICTEPTAEDHKWFPDIAGTQDWLSVHKHAIANFKDESFILQYLSPKVMRDFGMMAILDDDRSSTIQVTSIQDEYGYKKIREQLAEQQNVNNRLPNISISRVDFQHTRKMTLEFQQTERQNLDADQALAVVDHVAYLWGYPVELQVIANGSITQTYG
jgi:stage V sporulation protein R